MFGESLLSVDGSLTNIRKDSDENNILCLWPATSSDSVLSTQCHDVLSLVLIIADTGVEEETIHVSAGKDFAMVRTATGKVSAVRTATDKVI